MIIYIWYQGDIYVVVQMADAQIMTELRAIREELEYIKAHMVDIDMILTKEEEKMVQDCLDEHKKGKTVRLQDLKKAKK